MTGHHKVPFAFLLY